MPNVKVTIDGKQEFHGDLDDWTANPPDWLKDKIKPTAAAPMMKAVLVSLSDALLDQRDIEIEAQNRSYGWDVKVRYPNGK